MKMNVVRKETATFIEENFSDLNIVESEDLASYEVQAFAATLVVLPTLTTL